MDKGPKTKAVSELDGSDIGKRITWEIYESAGYKTFYGGILRSYSIPRFQGAAKISLTDGTNHDIFTSSPVEIWD